MDGIVFIVLIILIVILFVLYRKSRLNEGMNTWRQKALLKQMNSHFLFNSMNSINRYIVENNIESSNIYLSKFGRLMRKVLLNSQSNFISLKDEIDAIQLYIELEQMRLNNTFLYDIEIDENINISKVKIPPLLIQPLIENSIWHGLLHVENYKGKLKVKIQNQKKYIVISICDNGKGRQNSLHNHSPEQEPISTYIIKKRLSFYKKLKNIPSEFKYTDLFDGSKAPTGTKVELKLRLITS